MSPFASCNSCALRSRAATRRNRRATLQLQLSDALENLTNGRGSLRADAVHGGQVETQISISTVVLKANAEELKLPLRRLENRQVALEQGDRAREAIRAPITDCHRIQISSTCGSHHALATRAFTHGCE